MIGKDIKLKGIKPKQSTEMVGTESEVLKTSEEATTCPDPRTRTRCPDQRDFRRKPSLFCKSSVSPTGLSHVTRYRIITRTLKIPASLFFNLFYPTLD